MNIPNAILNLMGQRTLDSITVAIIHHTVAKKTLDITDIDQMEKMSQGFLAVGYHAYAKCLDVNRNIWVVQQGRPLNKVPAAALGMNGQSYDIAIGGNYEPGGAAFLDTVSPESLKVVADQIKLVKAKCPNLKYLIGHLDVQRLMEAKGDHGDYSTACPGRNLYSRLDDLRTMTGLAKL